MCTRTKMSLSLQIELASLPSVRKDYLLPSSTPSIGVFLGVSQILNSFQRRMNRFQPKEQMYYLSSLTANLSTPIKKKWHIKIIQESHSQLWQNDPSLVASSVLIVSFMLLMIAPITSLVVPFLSPTYGTIS